MKNRILRNCASILLVFCLTPIVLNFFGSCLETEMTLEPAENSKEVFSRLHLSRISEDPKINGSFYNYAVNEKGEYALVFDSSFFHLETIVVYSAANEFLYGYELPEIDPIALGWSENHLVLYLDFYAVVLGRSGECLELWEIPSTGENNGYLWELNYPKKMIDQTTYKAENFINRWIDLDFVRWGAYSRLIKTTESGEMQVLYQKSFGAVFISLLFWATLLFLLLFFIRCFVLKILGKDPWDFDDIKEPIRKKYFEIKGRFSR